MYCNLQASLWEMLRSAKFIVMKICKDGNAVPVFGCAGLLILQGCQFWAPSALKLGQDTTKSKFLLRHAFAVEFPYHVMMVYLI